MEWDKPIPYTWVVTDLGRLTFPNHHYIRRERATHIECKKAFRAFNLAFTRWIRELLKCFNHLADAITCVNPDVSLNFWLEAREIMENKVADDEDLAVFLCSIVQALGQENVEVIITELENQKTHAIVCLEHDREFWILDASQKGTFKEFRGSKAAVLEKYSLNHSKIKRFLYKFNNQNYEQFL